MCCIENRAIAAYMLLTDSALQHVGFVFSTLLERSTPIFVVSQGKLKDTRIEFEKVVGPGE